MTLDGNAKNTNIKRSLDDYINTFLGSSLNIEFEGLPFDNKPVSDWIRPKILDFKSTYLRQGSSTQYGEDINILFQINIFVKKSGLTSTDRQYEIRDSICELFKIGEDISIYNYTGGTEYLDKLRVRSLVNDLSLPEDGELLKYVLAWEMNYTRLTTERIEYRITEEDFIRITEDGNIRII